MEQTNQPNQDQSKKAGPKNDITSPTERLIEAIDKLTATQKKIEKQNRIGPTILRAVAYALGSTIGLAVVVSIIFYILKSFGLFDSFGAMFQNVKDLKNLYTQ